MLSDHADDRVAPELLRSVGEEQHMNEQKPNREEPSHEKAPEPTPERGNPGGTESEQNLPAQRRPVGSGEIRPEQGNAGTTEGS